MNSGAFGENFPYTNFHELNMDWIIKIAKDFLDQYTHIQEIIADGEASLQNLTESGLQQLGDLTTSGLQQLQDKADALEALLQAWYVEHSEDIANQLANALEDLNDWYTTHQNYLDQTLINKTNAFNDMADTKTAQCIASIPADYTALSNSVTNVINNSDEKITEVSHRPEQFIGVADESFLSKTTAPISALTTVDICTDIQNNPSGFLHSITINATANGNADICFLTNYSGDNSYMQIYAIISGISIKKGTHTYYNGTDFIFTTPIRPNSAICYYSSNGADLFTDGNTLSGTAYKRTHSQWGTTGIPSLFSKGGGNQTSYTFSIYFTIQTASNSIETLSKQICEITSLPEKYISYYNERFFDKNTLPSYVSERDVYTDLLNNKSGLLHSFTLNASSDGTAELCLLTEYSGDTSYLQIYAIISNVTIHKGIYTYVNGVDFTYNGLVKENSVLGYHSATAILYEDYQRTGNGGYARDHTEWGTAGIPSLVSKGGGNKSDYSYSLYLTIYRPNNNLVGKLGDSLGDSTTANGNWQSSVQKGLALANMLNHGVGATTVSGTSTDCMNNDARINALDANADLIIVLAGLNDFAQSKAMGEKSYANADVTTFFGACNVMFRKLANRYPTKRIVAFGTLFTYRPNNPAFTDGVINTQGLTSLEYSQAMMESAQLNGIEHYDIGGNLGINISNIMTYTEDGIHPNSDYSAKIAEYFVSKLTYNK